MPDKMLYPYEFQVTKDDIIFDCPACNSNLAIAKAGGGLSLNCPVCQALLQVPQVTMPVAVFREITNEVEDEEIDEEEQEQEQEAEEGEEEDKEQTSSTSTAAKSPGVKPPEELPKKTPPPAESKTTVSTQPPAATKPKPDLNPAAGNPTPPLAPGANAPKLVDLNKIPDSQIPSEPDPFSNLSLFKEPPKSDQPQTPVEELKARLKKVDLQIQENRMQHTEASNHYAVAMANANRHKLRVMKLEKDYAEIQSQREKIIAELKNSEGVTSGAA